MGFSRAVRVRTSGGGVRFGANLARWLLSKGSKGSEHAGTPMPRDRGGSAGRASSGTEDVIRTRMYICDRGDAEAVGAAHGGVWPPSTGRDDGDRGRTVQSPWKVETEAEAVAAPPPIQSKPPHGAGEVCRAEGVRARLAGDRAQRHWWRDEAHQSVVAPQLRRQGQRRMGEETT